MKKIILLLSAVLLWALPVSVSAQNKNNDKAKQQRKEQFDRFCKFRRDFMMKQIGLSEQEAKQFFPLYEEMEGKKWTVDREARTFARKIVRSETAVSDVEYEKAAEVLLEKDEKLAKIDRDYQIKFIPFHRMKNYLNSKMPK